MKISVAAFEAIGTHVSEGYPNEICGMLVAMKGTRTVTEIRRATNANTDRPRDTYQIDPREHREIEKAVDAAGLDIVGYYHTHPDHPAQASRFDTERAWAGYVYLIVAIHQGKPVDAKAFVADADGGPFHPEPLEVV